MAHPEGQFGLVNCPLSEFESSLRCHGPWETPGVRSPCRPRSGIRGAAASRVDNDFRPGPPSVAPPAAERRPGRLPPPTSERLFLSQATVKSHLGAHLRHL